MIKRVFVKGYKSLKDVDLALSPLTVIIGPNASGKSNLLDALGLLSRMVGGGTIKVAFDEHRGLPLEAFFLPPGGVDELLSQETLRFTLGVEVELSRSTITSVEKLVRDMRKGLPSAGSFSVDDNKRVVERTLRYEVAVEFVTSSGLLRIVDERLVALRRDGHESGSRRPFVSREGDKLHLRMEGQSHPTYHDLGLDHTVVSTALYPPHYPHITAFREELDRWKFYYFDPAVMRQETALRVVDTIGFDGRDLAGFYQSLKMQKPGQFDNLQRSLKQVIPSAESVAPVVTRDGLVHLVLSDDNTDYSSRVVSDGTLRVLGLLAILSPQSLTTTIGFEEPENGVHPRRLRVVARMLDSAVFGQGANSDRQVIITTHSPKLPEYLNPDYMAQDYSTRALLVSCRKEKGQTRLEPLPNSLLFAGETAVTALEEVLIRGDLGG